MGQVAQPIQQLVQPEFVDPVVERPCGEGVHSGIEVAVELLGGDGDLQTEGGEEALHQRNARHPIPALDAGHSALTRPGPIGQLLLGELSGTALPAKKSGDIRSETTTLRHLPMMA